METPLVENHPTPFIVMASHRLALEVLLDMASNLCSPTYRRDGTSKETDFELQEPFLESLQSFCPGSLDTNNSNEIEGPDASHALS